MALATAPSRIDPEVVADQLLEARARTLLLVAPLTDEDLHLQHDPLMSPILWDLGHIAHFEELWLTRNLDGPIEFVEMPGLYNPFEHPRSTRGIAGAAGPRATCATSWTRSAAACSRGSSRPTSMPANPLLRDGFVYHMVLQHEYQHNETILQTLQLKQGAPYRPLARVEAAARAPRPRWRAGARWCASRAEPCRSAPTTAPRPTTTSGRRTRWSWRRSGSTRTR